MDNKPSRRDNKPSRRLEPNSDKKQQQPGNNFVWYLLALGIGTLFLVSLMQSNRSTVEIPYSELVQLIKQGAPERTPDAKI